MTGSAFSEEKLFELPAGSGAASSSFATADGHVASFPAASEGGLRINWDGETGALFDQLIPMRDGQTLFWSDDRRHVALMAARGDKQLVWHDGVEDGPFDLISRSVPPTFSADGSRLAYSVRNGDRRQLIVDGEPTGEEPVGPVAAVFSPDGQRLAYALILSQEQRHRIVLDGVIQSELVGLANDRGVMQFSPDSRRFAYYTIGTDGEACWVVDGTPGRRFHHTIRELSFAKLRGTGVLGPPMRAAFSPDSRRFAYWADVKEKGVAVIEDATAGPVVKAATEPVFSPDARHLAYGVELLSGKFAVVRDGITGREGPGGSTPVFSPDSNRLAWTSEHEEGGLFRKRRVFSLIVDDQVTLEESGDDASRWPVFSPDSKHVAWWLIRKGEGVVYLDQTPVAIGNNVLSEPVITASGRLVCAMAIAGGQTVMVDGEPGPACTAMSAQTAGNTGSGTPDPGNPHFRVSPDGDHVAWAGGIGSAWAGAFAKGVRPILDRADGPPCDEVFSSGFDDAGRAFWLARREDVILRIRAT